MTIKRRRQPPYLPANVTYRYTFACVLLGAFAALFGACPDKESPQEPQGPVVWSLTAPAVGEGAVFSVWGASANDVWAVGGERGRALVLRYDGERWSLDAPPAAAEQLWWVHGVAGGPTLVVGDGGSSYAHEGGSWRAVGGAPAGATLYGVWMASATDGWAVGGPYDSRPAGVEPAGDVLLRYVEGAWVPQQVPALEGRSGQRRLFKVWGSSPTNVFVVGSEGLIMRYDGSSWTTMESGVNAQLFTVSGRGSDDVWVVGGGASGVLLRFDGATWSSWPLPEFTPQILQGVHAPAGRNEVFISGFFGFTARLDLTDGTWGRWEVPDAVTPHPLHAIFADSSGRVWAAGGDIAAAKSDYTGVILSTDPAVAPPTHSDVLEPDVEGDTESDEGPADVTVDGPDTGPVACETPATSCPSELPHSGAPCAGDLTCPYEVNDVLNSVHFATCDDQGWVVSTTCDPALGGGCAIPPLAESCTAPFSGTIPGGAVAIGPASGGAFGAFQDGTLVELVWGGQGSPMFEFRVQIEGDGTDALTCANVRTTIAIDGVPEVDAGQPVVFRCGSTLGVFVIVPASPIDCEDRIFKLEVTVEIEGVGASTVTLDVQGGQACFG